MTPSPEQDTICLSLVHGRNLALKILARCPERMVVKTYKRKRNLHQVNNFKANNTFQRKKVHLGTIKDHSSTGCWRCIV